MAVRDRIEPRYNLTQRALELRARVFLNSTTYYLLERFHLA